MKFAECLTNGGVSERGVRLLKPETIEVMKQDHVSAMGAKHDGLMLAYDGFGLAGGVITKRETRMERLPSRAAGVGTFGWGGAAGTYFFCDPVNRLSVVMFPQVLDYHIGMPTMRPDISRMCYCAFPDLKALQEASEAQGGGANDATGGFTG